MTTTITAGIHKVEKELKNGNIGKTTNADQEKMCKIVVNDMIKKYGGHWYCFQCYASYIHADRLYACLGGFPMFSPPFMLDSSSDSVLQIQHYNTTYNDEWNIVVFKTELLSGPKSYNKTEKRCKTELDKLRKPPEYDENYIREIEIIHSTLEDEQDAFVQIVLSKVKRLLEKGKKKEAGGIGTKTNYHQELMCNIVVNEMNHQYGPYWLCVQCNAREGNPCLGAYPGHAEVESQNHEYINLIWDHAWNMIIMRAKTN